MKCNDYKPGGTLMCAAGFFSIWSRVSYIPRLSERRFGAGWVQDDSDSLWLTVLHLHTAHDKTHRR